MSLKRVDIAVVGMSGIFPGACDTQQFIANVMAKKSSVIPVPQDRWGVPPDIMVDNRAGAPLPDRACSRFAGLISKSVFNPADLDFCGADKAGHGLDNDFFHALDPVHHLTLAAGIDLITHAGLSKESRGRTGVVLAAIALPTPGASRLTHNLFLTPNPAMPSRQQAWGAGMLSAPASILARVLGLNGGSFTLDAACASSLFSIKLACEQLLSGKADAMVAGGVSRPQSLYTQVGFTQLQALSPTGRCAPFDRDANGLVVGEGAGIVLLKRLDDALACRDTIHAVIKGWGVSNDIEGNLVAPASEGQVRAMNSAFDMAGWAFGDIQYMECHGSGTPKGDQVEVHSIMQMLEKYRCMDTALSIGSVKSNIGHMLTGAGAAGFIKTIMAMNQGLLPPSNNFNALPDDSPFKDTGVRVQDTPAAWAPAGDGQPLRAAVSAFGFGGINAQILVESFKAESRRYAVGFAPAPAEECVPCAIVGMGLISGGADCLGDFSRLIFGEKTPVGRSGEARWRRADHLPPEIRRALTLFMDELSIDLKDFNIPPNQMNQILPQHLIMLKSAMAALADAGISSKPDASQPLRVNMGCAVGIEFDFGATDYHLRWQIQGQEKDVSKELLDTIGPSLNFGSTLGALGGIVASRLARAFKLGGPCFTLSADEASGQTAIDIAVKSLSAGETDTFLCAAVDLAADIRSFTRNLVLTGADPMALPSEGAVALVLKPLEAAQKDNDRIYAVVNGVGRAGGAAFAGEIGDQAQVSRSTVVQKSLQMALDHAGMDVNDIGLGAVTHSASHFLGAGEVSGLEFNAFPVFCPSALSGHTGAAAGLFTVTAAALCLYTQKFPGPLSNAPGIPQTAVAGCLTRDGIAGHVVLSGHQNAGQGGDTLTVSVTREKNGHSPTCIKIPVTRPPFPRGLIATEAFDCCPGPLEAPLSIPCDTLPGLLAHTQAVTARAHERFLELSAQNTQAMAEQLAVIAGAGSTGWHASTGLEPVCPLQEIPKIPEVFMDRNQCLEFAVGKAGNVLGPDFDIIDTYPVRVRLPNEPLMLVDRIVSVHGEKLSLTSGKVITQHDVHENAWYLDGGKAPVSISIEAGQADLFLCSWLGIDHVVKGKRKYRLLDAKVTFHRSLPVPGETIEYHIEIDRFLRQGDIYLFFFHYQGYINQLPFISMRDGCAGFFTEQEVENSGGIILKNEDKEMNVQGAPPAWFAPVKRLSLNDEQVDALRTGDLETAFGADFQGKRAGKNQWLPGGPMRLIHRVLDLDPTGGRFGMGRIIAQADIHPDDWFLTCHFIDDMVMPGTLMYECCAHTLRVFVQRMGWVLPDDGICYDVLEKNESDLKCRGPVTRATKKTLYDIEIKSIGYEPQPFVTADAHMFSDDLEIVFYKDMGIKLTGLTRQDLEAYWRKK
ncbi:beta-ketoacyl synthase [Desulfobacter hydrogenophilus]|uniref:Beta-ketoacyl synthase n=1 Tax=Desulfobacter hydrogenophilus TaxID=2291 RepID=A0A328F9X3_9BACT|nr:beta-ketoacyl synthase N-terminal-like domain-containing protein [Desulfobacter hydrogenophilus]NDY72669.1 beta-ketoacyl synthase [Desulfobacter hydrogenophilus]QBH14512.1 beta-ketoacyl synthase [Desulfobacter hydrogenophilus]RAM01431.1 beta-ketoacyl synthase [Desulfobacter hydrogenophilus]